MTARLIALIALCLGLWITPARAAAGPDQPGQQVLVLLRLPTPHYRPGGEASDGYGDGLGRAERHRAAAQLAQRHGLSLVTEWPMPLLAVDCFVMQAPAGRSAEEAAAALSHDPGVVWSEPMRLYRAQGQAVTHNDPLFAAQPAAAGWRLADMHQMATGQGVMVAIIDSQIEANHPDLQGQVRISRDFAPGHPAVSEAHGTGVAGVIAARADNGLGIVGVAPRASLMALRACWQVGGTASEPAGTMCDSLTLAEALHFAIEHGAGVINLSLSGPPDRLLGRLIDVAQARGATVVGAYDPHLAGGGFPASHPGVIAVAAESDIPSAPGIVTAPGRDVPTTQPGGQWSLVNGGSYAAAHVSGLFALLRQRGAVRPGIGSLVAVRGRDGAIDTCATLLHAVGPCDCACAHTAITRR